MGSDRRFASGDALRGLAALMVLVFHCALWAALVTHHADPRLLAPAYGHAGLVLRNLESGLYVFFALSGYLVGGPWVRAFVLRQRPPRLGRYASRRLRRIVPAFWLVAALLLIRHGVAGSSVWQVASIFLFAQDLAHAPARGWIAQAWTLDIEMAFYVGLPLIAGLVAGLRALRPGRAAAGGPRHRAALVLAVLAVTSLASVKLRAAGAPDQALTRNLAALWFAFVPGLALAAVEPLVLGRGAARRWHALALLALAAAGALALVRLDPDTARGYRAVASAALGGGLVGAALVWQWATGRAPRLATTRPVVALGRWSYGIYLVHGAVGFELLNLVRGAGGPVAVFVAVLPGTLLGSVVVAAALWRFVERPALERRLALPWLRQPAAQRAPA